MNLAQISSSLIFITTIAIVTGEKLNNSSITTQFYLPFPELGVFPVHYAIRLTALIEKYDSNMTQPSDTKQEYSSLLPYRKSFITINIIQLTRKIQLHALNIRSSSVTLTGRNNIPYATREIIYISETNILEIYFSDILYPGVYSLTLESRAQNTDDTENVFESSYINREKRESIMYLIAPHIQVDGARRLFPCWDEPHFKTTFAISVKHYRNLTALSNMPMKAQDKDNDDLMWTYFYTTPPISTYQVSIILTNFNHILIKENIKLWCKTGSTLQPLKYAEQVIKNITVHLESEFYGIKIPKMDHVAIPNFPHDGTSKWGLIFHREEDLIYDERLDPVMRKIEIAHSIAPKIAYQWLGNAITPSSWTDFWLHDGLAVLFGEEAIAKVFNNSEIMDLFIVQTQYHSLHLDSHFDMNPPGINSLSEIDSIFGSVHYMKVMIVLRMLQNEITDKMFREGVRTLLRNYMSTPLTPNNFWDVYIQGNLTKAYYNISPDFQKWIIYRHYPIINWTQENPQYRTLTQYCVNTSSYGKWWIPVSLRRKIFIEGVIKVFLTPQEPSENITYFEHSAEDDRIIVDIQQAGYYRANYETNNWRKIAYYLNSGEYKDKRMRELLAKPLEILGFEDRPMESDFTKCLRQEIVKWACTAELSNNKCLQMARSKLEQHLEYSELNSIHWRESIRQNATKEDINIYIRTVHSTIVKYANDEIALYRILWNLQHIKPPEISTAVALIDIINHIYNTTLLSMLHYTLHQQRPIDLDRGQIESKVYSKIAERSSEIERQIDHFDMLLDKSISITKKSNVKKSDVKKPDNKLHYTLHQQRPIDLDRGQIESKVYSKIAERSSEIERQIDHFDMLLDKSISITKKSNVKESDVKKPDNKLHYTLHQQRPIDLDRGQIESKVYSKIAERSSEIERQIDHFDMLLDKSISITKKSNVKESDVKKPDNKLHYTLHQQRPIDLDRGQIKSKVYSKIAERSSEIERQIDHFDMLLDKSISITTKSNVKESDVKKPDNKVLNINRFPTSIGFVGIAESWIKQSRKMQCTTVQRNRRRHM
ncbi:aminopeptidase A-like isoform X2 [Temnothorax nylanderi]|uniref:aminopeptidase A-like isoform X2 n=1 Tax=Temnothorax nylanderi TaxID=102681 RepID=UPI003A8C6A68